MKNFKFYFFFILFALPMIVWAQAAAVDPAPLIKDPSSDELGKLLQAIGGLKGAGAMAIATLVVQGLMLALRSKLGEYAGKWRLAVLYTLTFIANGLALKLAGVELGAILIHSTILGAVQNAAVEWIRSIKQA